MRWTAKHRRVGAATLICTTVWAFCTGSASADDWYQPATADFRPLYDRDAVNQRYEPWEGASGYWPWVQVFYNGYTKRVFGVKVFRQEGWTESGRRLEARLTSTPAHQSLRRALNRLGRDIAGEWAKDDDHRRINESDLRRWGRMTQRAGERDDGTARMMLATIRVIQTEVSRRLADGR